MAAARSVIRLFRPGDLVAVALLHALVAQQPDAAGGVLVAADDHAALAGGHVLGGVEAERGDVARGRPPGSPSYDAPWACAASSSRSRPWRSATLGQPVPARPGGRRGGPGCTAAVRGVTAAATASGSRQNVSGSMSANTGVAPGHGDGVGGRGERERGDDDLVARPDAGGEQAEVQGAGAGVDRHAGAPADDGRRTPPRRRRPPAPGRGGRCAGPAVTAAISSSPTWTCTALTRAVACSVMVPSLAQASRPDSTNNAPVTGQRHGRRPRATSRRPAGPDPADPACRGAGHQRVVGHVVHHDRARGDHRPPADGRPARRRPRGRRSRQPSRSVTPDRLSSRRRSTRDAVGADRARVLVVGQHGGRPDEDAVLDHGRLVDLREVLHLHRSPSRTPAPTYAPRPIDAVRAEDGALADLGEAPDDGALADRGVAATPRRLGQSAARARSLGSAGRGPKAPHHISAALAAASDDRQQQRGLHPRAGRRPAGCSSTS